MDVEIDTLWQILLLLVKFFLGVSESLQRILRSLFTESFALDIDITLHQRQMTNSMGMF